MSLFQCENCGCIENTALSHQGFSYEECFDWTGKEHMRGWKLCSACGPSDLDDGESAGHGGKWHGEFPRRYLPLGMFKTNGKGNLEHIETGEPPGDYELDEPETPLERRERGRLEDFRYIESPKVLEVGPRRPRVAHMALLAGILPTMAGMGGAGEEMLSRPMAPARRGPKTLDELDAKVRDDEARIAKAEAKRQRRRERNQRLAGVTVGNEEDGHD